MNEIEKIQRYIKLTGSTYKSGSPYNLVIREARALRNMGDFYEALGLAFEYGRAKGVRSVRAEQRREAHSHCMGWGKGSQGGFDECRQ